jgi:glutamine amidotransferase
MLTIVDYKSINLGSICNMLKFLGTPYIISSDPSEIAKASKLIFPGIGSFDHAMGNIERFGMREILIDLTLNKSIPILGICLGMQLLTKGSEEGSRPGLGIIEAETLKFPPQDPLGNRLKVPHMGWNTVQIKKSNPLIANNTEEQRFYFVHSYYVKCVKDAEVLMTTTHGISFHSAFQVKNIIGVQFHPEKSHRFGISLFRQFVETTIC